MEEVFRLEIDGKFNGRDARITVGLDAESAFEIDEMETASSEESTEAESESETESEATSEAEAGPETTESPEGAGLDQLFPEEEGEATNLPPLSADTLQFKPAKVLYNHEDEKLTSREILELVQEEHPEEDWNESKVTSHLYSLHDKGIVDREKSETSGKNEYFITDLGKTTVKMAMSESEE